MIDAGVCSLKKREKPDERALSIKARVMYPTSQTSYPGNYPHDVSVLLDNREAQLLH